MTQQNPALPLMQQYDDHRQSYIEFTDQLQQLVHRLLKEKAIRVHSVQARLKERSSFQAKVEAAPNRYSGLSDVTDLVGIRVITYFEDEARRAANVIESEFQIDRANSEDKSALVDPDRFGYLSLHYVVSLPAKRGKLPEYKRFASFKAEVQVRSILQHAWAEIHHDLGYKTKEAIPRDSVRAFARLAGMLELVDVEFVRLRDDLGDYAKDVARRIASSPGSVEVDQASLIAYIKKDALVKRLDKQISASAAIPLRGQPRLGWMVKAVRYHGIETIGDLQQLLQKFGSEAVDLEAESDKDDPLSYVRMPRGFSLSCLCNYLAAMKGSEQAYLDYLESVWGAPDESPFESNSELAKRMVAAYCRMMDPWRDL